MKLRIDKLGRIVLPKPMRNDLGLHAGAELEVEEQAGGILLRPAGQKPSMIRVHGLWVHTGSALPGANWNTLLDDVREERIQATLKL